MRDWQRKRATAARNCIEGGGVALLDLRYGHISEQIEPRSSMSRLYRSALKGDPCSYCGGRGGSVDHIEPVHRAVAGSKWNLAEWENVTGACSDCNKSKRTLPVLHFLVYAAVRRELAGVIRASQLGRWVDCRETVLALAER